LLAAMLAVAIVMGFGARIRSNGRHQQELVARLRGMGGKIEYDFQLHDDAIARWKRSLARRLDADFVGEVVHLNLDKVVKESNLRDYGLQDIAELRGLETLSLVSFNYDTLYPGNPSPPDFLRAIADLPNLKQLSLCYAPVLPDLAPLARLPRLHSLDLRGSQGVTAGGLQVLMKFPKLRVLGLTSTDVNDEALTLLIACPFLEELQIGQLHGRESVTPEGLARLKASKSLRKVQIDWWQSEEGLADLLTGIEIEVDPKTVQTPSHQFSRPH
jgi:hypothetical protein